MSLTKVVASPQYTLLRGADNAGQYAGNMLVSLFSNRVLLAGQINSDLTGSGSWMQFNYNNVSVGSYTNVYVEQALLIGKVNDIKKATFYGRIRLPATSTIIYSNESSQDFTIGDYFWVIDNHLPQYRLSRPSTLDPATAIELVDGDQGFSQPWPMIVGLKTGYAGYVNPTTGKLRLAFDASQSFPVASGDSISSYGYFFPGGATVVAGGTNQPIVVVDLDPGEQWAQLDVASSTGSQRRYFGLKVHDTGSNQPDVGFDGGSIDGEITRGWTCSLPAFTGVDNVLNNTCAIVWRANEQYGGTTQTLYGGGSANISNKALTSNVATLTATGHPFSVGQQVIIADVDSTFNGTYIITATTVNTFSYAKVHANVASAAASGMAVVNPDNVLFVGWFQTESDNTAADMAITVKSGATFTFTGVGPRLSRIVAQLLAFQLNASPTLWGQIVNLTVWRALCHFFARYTTIAYTCDVTFDSIDNTYLFPTITTQGGNFFASPGEIAKQIDAALEFGLAGQIAINREVAYLDQTARNALPTIAGWTSADGYAVDRQVDPMPNVGRSDGDGLFYNSFSGGLPSGYTVRAPGFAQGEAQGSSTLSNQILAATSDPAAALTELKQRIGNKFEYDNLSEYLDWEHPAGYVGVGLMPSRSELYTFTLDTTLAGPNGVNRIIYDTSVLWTIDSVRIAYNVNVGDFAPHVRYRRVPRIGDPGDDTTKIAPGTIAPALPDLGLPSFDFQLPEFTFPDTGLLASQVNPLQLLPPPGKAAYFNGQELLAKSSTKAYYLTNFITLKTPHARDITPTDLGSFTIQAILADIFSPTGSVGAYILATDGTNSAIWYSSNVANTPPAWTKGAEFPNVFTVLRSGNTAGSVVAYSGTNPGTNFIHTFDFSINDGSWTAGFPTAPASYGSGRWNSTHYSNGLVGQADSLYILSAAVAPTFFQRVRVIGFATYAAAGGGRTVNAPAGALPQNAGAIDSTVTLNNTYPQIAVDLSSNNTGDSTPTSGKNYITKIVVSGSGSDPFTPPDTGNAQSVVASFDYGATVGVPLAFGAVNLSVGGFDLQKAGGVSYAAASGAIYKASSIGGTYLLWFSVPASATPVCLIVPYFKRNSTTLKNTTTSTPDVIAACDNGKLYWIDGATATATDITPTGMTAFDNANCVTISYGTHLACFGKVSGTYHLFTSTDGGSTWTDRTSLTAPHFIRGRRNDTRAKTAGNHGQLYLAVDDVIDYSSIWDGAGMSIRNMPSSGIDAFDTVY